MVTPKRGRPKRKRVTEEMITVMRDLYSQGMPISAIAGIVGVHRQTVSAYIAEKQDDIFAEDVRKQLLREELKDHFRQLATFVRKDIRKQLNASAPGDSSPAPGTISTAGILGLPYTGTASPHYICSEWSRMYDRPLRDQHLLLSLREHTRGSKLWVHWDRWSKKVAAFEGASRVLWEWIGQKLENEPSPDIRDLEKVRSWVFGNLIGMADGRDPAGIETLTQSAEPGEVSPVAYSHPSPLSRYAEETLEEARRWPELGNLKSSIAELKDSGSQSELRRLAREIDFVLAGIELMNAFPGRCQICPV